MRAAEALDPTIIESTDQIPANEMPDYIFAKLAAEEEGKE